MKIPEWPKGKKTIPLREAAELLRPLLDQIPLDMESTKRRMVTVSNKQLLFIFNNAVDDQMTRRKTDWQSGAAAVVKCLINEFDIPSERIKAAIWPTIRAKALQ